MRVQTHIEYTLSLNSIIVFIVPIFFSRNFSNFITCSMGKCNFVEQSIKFLRAKPKICWAMSKISLGLLFYEKLSLQFLGLPDKLTKNSSGEVFFAHFFHQNFQFAIFLKHLPDGRVRQANWYSATCLKLFDWRTCLSVKTRTFYIRPRSLLLALYSFFHFSPKSPLPSPP